MLRAARAEDAAAVARVLLDSRHAFLPFVPWAHADDDVREWVRTTLLPEGRVVVCETADGVVGVLATSVAQGIGWIDQMYVLPGHTGQGLGGALLAFAHDLLPRPVRLYTFQQNLGARRFYERHGYRPIAFTDGQQNEERCPDVLYELPARPPAARR
jgi:GNAT superfamily N-acetyltransferase